jgi:hypothetical protein
MSESGRKRLQELAKAIRDKATAADHTALNRKGLVMIELLARDLSAGGDAVPPGLEVHRDAPSKLHLTRGERNARIAVEWQRDIGAAVMTWEKLGEPTAMRRYVYEEPKDRWRRMDGEDELYDDLVSQMIETLYPEAKS